MTRSVKLKTAVPSLEEFGKNLGISKTRQKAIIAIIRRDPAVARSQSKKASAEQDTQVSLCKTAGKIPLVEKGRRAAAR